MASRLIFSGHKVSFGRLLDKLKSGEKLVAVYQRDYVNTLHAKRIFGEKDYITIAGQTKHGFYHNLHWYASSMGSEEPADYLLP